MGFIIFLTFMDSFEVVGMCCCQVTKAVFGNTCSGDATVYLVFKDLWQKLIRLTVLK